MRQFSVMIKPASALCNMRCKYCFYHNVTSLREVYSFGIMKSETMELMLENILKDLEDGDYVTFAFQGGEPTLAGISYFEKFVQIVGTWQKNINVSYAIQTNGINLDENWAKFLHNNNFLVGLSLDLLQDQHNKVRIDDKGDGTWKKVAGIIDLMRVNKVEFNVLCTLTNGIARYPKKVWNQILKLDLKYVQFTPCLDDLSGEEKKKGKKL